MREEHSENFEGNAGESEEVVANLIGRLPKVEAPADFDIKVRARIAERRASGKKGIAWLRLALPGAGLALIVGIFSIAAFLRIGDDVAMVAPPEGIEPAQVFPEPPAPSANAPAADATVVERVLPANIQPSTIPAASRPPDESSQGRKTSGPAEIPESDDSAGSRDISLRPPSSIDIPSEVRSSSGAVPADVARSNERRPTGLPLAQALSFAGLNLEFAGKRIVIASIRPNSAGARSGMLAGDIIEQINDRPVAAGDEFSEIKTVTVNRGGQRVRIALRPGQ